MKQLPIIRVTKNKAGTAVTKPTQALDAQMYDILFKIANNSSRMRSRIDGCEARLEHLEALLQRSNR